MVLTGCVNGFGKRTPVEDYRLIRRGGKGVINIKTTDRNGDVVGMQAVCDEDELMLITEKGILIRTRVSEIRETGRNAAGVKLIRIDDGDKLVAMAKVDASPVVDETAPATTDETNPDAPDASAASPDAGDDDAGDDDAGDDDSGGDDTGADDSGAPDSTEPSPDEQ
jgi:DNA gyrase subunit A